MMANPFRQLADTIQSRSAVHVNLQDVDSILTEVLDDHLDSIAAAHGSAHHSVHNSMAPTPTDD